MVDYFMGITLTDEWYRQNVAQTSRSNKKKGRKMKRNKKSTKHYPVQNKIRLAVAQPSAPDTGMLVRTDKLLSNVNHRLYRQSRVYCLKVDIDADLPDGSYVDVLTISDTWYNQKAYQLAKQMFDLNSQEEIAFAGSTKARWNDFRVDHGLGPGIQQEYQASQGGLRFAGGEYELSEITNAAGTAQTFRWFGSGANTFNIIDEYDITGNTDASPTNAIGSVAYDGVTDEMDDAQMLHITADGDEPPYDRNALENQCWYRVHRLFIDSTGTSKLSTGYFDAPCGLVQLVLGGGLTAVTSDEKIQIEVKGGDYKGVHAPSYLE